MQTSRLIVWLRLFMDIVWYVTVFVFAYLIITFPLPNNAQYMSHAVMFRLDESSYSITSNNPAIENPLLRQTTGEIIYRLGGARKFLLLLLAMPGFAFLLLIIDRLRKLLGAIVENVLLNRSSVNNLRTVGWLLIASELWKWLVNGLSNLFVARTFTAEGLTLLDFGFKIDPFFSTGNGYFSGFVILVVAEIIAYAVTLQNERDALRDEQALTV